MIIYTLMTATYHSQWHFIKPRQQQLAMAGFYLDAIRVWVSNYWTPEHAKLGLQPHDMHLMMQKWWVVNKHTKGFSGDVALTAAKVNMRNWVSQRAGSFARPAIGLWAGLIAVGIFFAWLEWARGGMVTKVMTPHRILMRYEERLWWGALIWHPTENEWDFQQCRETGFSAWTHEMPFGPGLDNLDYFFVDELWQTLANGVFGWRVLSWHDLVGNFRGIAHNRGFGRYRLLRPEGAEDPWGVPVGWTKDKYEACEYFDLFGHPFEW